MKQYRSLITLLAGLCVLFALVSLFQPNRGGMALSYLTVSLACVVGVLCVGGLIRLFFSAK